MGNWGWGKGDVRFREAFFRGRRGRLLGFSRGLWSGLWRGRRLGRGRFVVLRTFLLSLKKAFDWLGIDVVKIMGLKCCLCEISELVIYWGGWSSIYISLFGAGVAFATCDVLVTLLSMSRAVPFVIDASCGNMDLEFWTRGECDAWPHRSLVFLPFLIWATLRSSLRAGIAFN
jgi:hypothetical protein